MNRARMLGGLLAAILLACALVIYLDQRGTFGNAGNSGSSGTVSTPATSGSTTPAPTPQPSGGSGYGNVK